MRTTMFSLSLLAAPVLLAACGDDTVDPMCPDPVDAAACPVPDDAPQQPVFKGYDADEGGEIRVEYIKFPNATVGTRITAYAFQDPGSVKFRQFVNLAGCTDVSTDANFAMYWPTGTNPVAERTYYDLGSVAVHNADTAIIAPPVTAAGNDLYGRPHPADVWYRRNVTGMSNDGATTVTTEKTFYSVSFGGSDTFPGQTFTNAVYMPASFDLDAGGIPHGTGADGNSGGVLAANTAVTFKWSTPAEATTEEPIYGLVGFIAGGRPRVICVEDNADATPGEITVPANFIDIARAAIPADGFGGIARQTLHHVVRELKDSNGPTGRRFDLVGVWCYAGTNYRANPVQ